MPELPDVEGFRRVFLHHAANQRVDHIDVRDEGVVHGRSGASFARNLKGAVLRPPERRGKWLLAPTDGPMMLVHFGMTGSLVWRPEGSTGTTDTKGRFDRVVFELARGHLIFRDQRKLGGLWLAGNDKEMAAVTGPLGPDALGLGRRELFECLEGHRGALKPILMDQSVVAGLGNMLSDEVLWRAKVHPSRKFADLTPAERTQLHRSLQQVLQSSVTAGHIPRRKTWLSSQRSIDDPRCPRQHGSLRTSRIGQRTSYWCPTCQPPTH